MIWVYAVAVALGQALGYGLVRLFCWAWPSLWQLLRPEGRAFYRLVLETILKSNHRYLRWRAHYYAFVEARHAR